MWNGVNGDQIHYINGAQVKTSNSRKSWRAGGFFLLGQDQDSVGGGFDAGQRFIGDICNFQMWDRVLNDDERQRLWAGQQVIGNVFDSPISYNYELQNGAEEKGE